jgi:hypothetical protein
MVHRASMTAALPRTSRVSPLRGIGVRLHRTWSRDLDFTAECWRSAHKQCIVRHHEGHSPPSLRTAGTGGTKCLARLCPNCGCWHVGAYEADTCRALNRHGSGPVAEQENPAVYVRTPLRRSRPHMKWKCARTACPCSRYSFTGCATPRGSWSAMSNRRRRRGEK